MKNSNNLRKALSTSLIFSVLALPFTGCATKQTNTEKDRMALQKAERFFDTHQPNIREPGSEN